jgi:hypothetical protein
MASPPACATPADPLLSFLQQPSVPQLPEGYRLEESTGELVGFVRATSDMALNANLWNLSARPGPDQGRLLTVLMHRALHILRRDLPGCSLSVSAPAMSLEALKGQGFVIDPSGIRAMGLRLKSTSGTD